MRRFLAAGWAALLLLVVSACVEQGSYTATLLTHGVHTLAAGEEHLGDVYLLDGELVIPSEARLDGSLFILSGRAVTAGEIEGDISLVGGELVLEPGAQVNGKLNAGGGTLQRAPDAQIHGGVQAGIGLELPDGETGDQDTGGFPTAMIFQDLVVAGLAYLLARYFPEQLNRVAQAIGHHPVASGAVGLLSGVVAVVLLVLMAFTIILIPVTFAGGAVLMLALFYGWAGFGALLGRLLRLVFRWKLARPWEVFTGTALFLTLYELSRLAPLLRDIVPLVTGLVGFGAVMLTRFGLHHFVPAIDRESLEGFPAPGTET